MSVVALEAVVEKGTIRLDALLAIPDQTKVFVVIPDVESPSPVEPTLDEPDAAHTQPESALESARRLQQLAARSQAKGKVKLSDYAGVGKELWQQIDVDEYLRQERESWDRPIS